MSTECAARTPSQPTDLDYPFELAPWASPTTIPNAVEPSPEKDLVRMKSLTHYGGYAGRSYNPIKSVALRHKWSFPDRVVSLRNKNLRELHLRRSQRSRFSQLISTNCSGNGPPWICEWYGTVSNSGTCSSEGQPGAGLLRACLCQLSCTFRVMGSSGKQVKSWKRHDQRQFQRNIVCHARMGSNEVNPNSGPWKDIIEPDFRDLDSNLPGDILEEKETFKALVCFYQ